MRVVHVLTAGASRYDRACTAIDLAIGPDKVHDLFEQVPGGWLRNGGPSSVDELSGLVRSDAASVIHVHGWAQPPGSLLRGLKIPWVSDRRVPLPSSMFRRLPPPKVILAERPVPEAACEEWFVERQPGYIARSKKEGRRRIGSFVRNAGTRNNAEQAFGRVQSFRDDVEWILFEKPPTPQELSALDLWIDPAAGEDDAEGMVVEAIACLTPVVAARTALNSRRLDGGKAGILPPRGDHNEMTHAILGMLFKDEVAMPLMLHAERIRNLFRPVHRRTAVAGVYEEVTS